MQRRDLVIPPGARRVHRHDIQLARAHDDHEPLDIIAPTDGQRCQLCDLRAVDLEGLIGLQLGPDERSNLAGTLGPLVGRGGRDRHLLDEADGAVQGRVMDVDGRVVSPAR
jgi:hypothetical protein